MIRTILAIAVFMGLGSPAAGQTTRPTPAAAPPVSDKWLNSIKEQDGWLYLGVAEAGAAVFILDEEPRGKWPQVRVWTRYEFPKPMRRQEGSFQSAMGFGVYDCDGLRQSYLAEYRYPGALLSGEVMVSEDQEAERDWITPKPESDEGALTRTLCKLLDPDRKE